MDGWVALIRSSPNKWKALIKKAWHIAVWKSRVEDLHQQFLGLSAKQLICFGASVPLKVAESLESSGKPAEVSGPCGKFFKDKRSWAVHAFKCHGRVRAARRLVSGETCPICLRVYASHLHHSTVCARQLHLAGFEAPVQPGLNSRKVNRGPAAFGPVLDAQGPLPRAVMDDGTIGIPVVEQIVVAFRDLRGHSDLQQFGQVLDFCRQILLSFCASLEDVATALVETQKELCGEQGEDTSILHLVLHKGQWHGYRATSRLHGCRKERLSPCRGVLVLSGMPL